MRTLPLPKSLHFAARVAAVIAIASAPIAATAPAFADIAVGSPTSTGEDSNGGPGQRPATDAWSDPNGDWVSRSDSRPRFDGDWFDHPGNRGHSEGRSGSLPGRWPDLPPQPPFAPFPPRSGSGSGSASGSF